MALVSHAGGTYGQQSNLALVPERGFAMTVLTNADSGAVLATEATDWAVERFLGLAPPARRPVSLPPERRAEYAGEYIIPADGGTIRVSEGEEFVAPRAARPRTGPARDRIGRAVHRR
jgi:hypothetical protein